MARIDVLPSIDIIRGFKGILDFYMWKGLPCVRAWPRWRPARQSDASKAAALLFGAVIKAYSLLGQGALEAYREGAVDIPRTARDVMLSGVYGNLHEASMSDFLDLLTECRDFLSALTAILDALHSIDTDELVVRVEHSVLPDTASTAAAQATQLTALQKIDDLQNALESKALDRLLVRGMDQVFSYRNNLSQLANGNPSGDNGWLALPTVPANRIWIITNLVAWDATRALTDVRFTLWTGALTYDFAGETRAIAAGERIRWSGYMPCDTDDIIRTVFAGALAGDTCHVRATGFIITREP